MTDEEVFAEADATDAALPGTPPNGWSFISQAELDEAGDRSVDLLRERLAQWTDMTWQRLTRVEEPEPGIWIELWKERPHKEAPFQQLLVAL